MAYDSQIVRVEENLKLRPIQIQAPGTNQPMDV